MKTASVFLMTVVLTMSSFKKKPAEPADQMAQHVLTAFQHSSPQEFALQFPTLSEFHKFMDENATIYGDMLPEAKRAFAAEYESDLLPEAESAFQHILLQGKKKGIDWNSIQYLRTDVSNVSGVKTATLTIL